MAINSQATNSSRIVPRKFVLRTYRRIPTWYTSYYLGGAVIGKGIVTNLSHHGMRMLVDHAPKAGADFCVRLHLDEDQPPIEITRATVRWVSEGEFGLRFDDLTAAAAGRIAEMLSRQAGAGRNGW